MLEKKFQEEMTEAVDMLRISRGDSFNLTDAFLSMNPRDSLSEATRLAAFVFSYSET